MQGRLSMTPAPALAPAAAGGDKVLSLHVAPSQRNTPRHFDPREPNWTRLKSPHTFAFLATWYYVPAAYQAVRQCTSAMLPWPAWNHAGHRHPGQLRCCQ